MRKILVVNMNYMGDALLTTPALAALRCAYPDAQIDTVVGAGAATEVLRSNPDLDQIIARTARGSWARCVQLYTLLRQGRYTDAIILPPLPAYAIAAFLARTPVRVGQANRGMNRFLTQMRSTRAVHMADAMLDTVPVPPDARPARKRLTITVEREAYEAADRLLEDAGVDRDRPLVAVNVGATRPQKRWFAESFAATLDALPGVQCVLVGVGKEDERRAEEIMQLVRRARPVSLVGHTSVKALAAVLSACDAVLSADSGPMHLATAVGTPVVAVFGSTDPAATGPYDGVSRSLYKALPCSPCGNHPTCEGRYDCLRAITPDEVALAVQALVRQRRSPAATLPLPLFSAGRQPGAAPLSDIRETAIERILIVTKFRFIGDTLLAIPIFRAARAQWPRAHIALLTGSNARALLQNNPYLDEIIEFDPYKQDYGWRPSLRLIRRLRAGKFDLSLILNRSFHSALISWLGGIRLRAGFRCEGRDLLLNRPTDYDREKSEVACYFDVLQAAAPEARIDPPLELWVSDAERRQAAQHLRDALGGDFWKQRLIGIQPGASQPGKRWAAARYAAVAESLIADDPRARLVVIGGPDERGAADEMRTQCDAHTRSRTVDFAGAFDLRGSLALIAHLQLFIGNDTAVMHSAVALGVPTVALFGPTNPRKWGNYGLRHRVLESPDGTMAELQVADVLAAARALTPSRTPVAPAAEHTV